MAQFCECAAEGRLLWIEHLAYTAKLLGGGSYPWLDVTSCVAQLRQAQGLLRSDVVTLPVAEVAGAWLADDPGLKQTMAERKLRPYGPLKELLANVQLRHHLHGIAVAMRASMPTALLALALPSPRDWAAQALESVGGTANAVDEDAVDVAAACIADFLRQFASSGIDAVLLRESRPWEGGDAELLLELYRPVANVAGHYDWDWGMELPGVVELSPRDAPGFTIAPGTCGVAPAGLMVPADFWRGQALSAPPPGSFDQAIIPPDAHPEAVLAQLGALRKRAAKCE